MSKTKSFPIFVARPLGDSGCGHQHQTRERAENCARGLLERGTLGRRVEIVKVTRVGDAPREQLVGAVES